MYWSSRKRKVFGADIWFWLWLLCICDNPGICEPVLILISDICVLVIILKSIQVMTPISAYWWWLWHMCTGVDYNLCTGDNSDFYLPIYFWPLYTVNDWFSHTHSRTDDKQQPTGAHIIRDSSDYNSRFYVETYAGESQSGLHIEKWEFSDISWCHCSAYLLLYLADLSSRTRWLSHQRIILQGNHN